MRDRVKEYLDELEEAQEVDRKKRLREKASEEKSELNILMKSLGFSDESLKKSLERRDRDAKELEENFNSLSEEEKILHIEFERRVLDREKSYYGEGSINYIMLESEIPRIKRIYNVVKEEKIIKKDENKNNKLFNVLIDDEGRMFPYEPENTNLDSKVQVRLPDDEKDAINQICLKRNIKPSDFLRNLIRREILEHLADSKIKFNRFVDGEDRSSVQVLTTYKQAVDFITECFNESVQMEHTMRIYIDTNSFAQEISYKPKEVRLNEHNEDGVKYWTLNLDNNIEIVISSNDYIDINLRITEDKNEEMSKYWSIDIINRDCKISITGGVVPNGIDKFYTYKNSEYYMDEFFDIEDDGERTEPLAKYPLKPLFTAEELLEYDDDFNFDI